MAGMSSAVCSELQHFFTLRCHITLEHVQEMVPSLEPLGLDLLSQMLRYEPSQRITARAAVQHPYFRDVAQSFAQRILVA